jgi:hypothetical protein
VERSVLSYLECSQPPRSDVRVAGSLPAVIGSRDAWNACHPGNELVWSQTFRQGRVLLLGGFSLSLSIVGEIDSIEFRQLDVHRSRARSRPFLRAHFKQRIQVGELTVSYRSSTSALPV